MASTLTVFTITWVGPYTKKEDLPNHKSNMIYLWTGQTGPKATCKPCYCGISGRGTKRFLDKDHKKDKILSGKRKCWIGYIKGGKRETQSGRKNTAYERSENLIVFYLKNYQRCLSLNVIKKNSPNTPVGIFNILKKLDGSKRALKPKDIKPVPRILLWTGERVITDEKKIVEM